MFLLVILIFSVAPRIITSFLKGDFNYSVEELNIASSKIEVAQERVSKKEEKKSRYKLPPAKFDPNLYNKQDWMKLGLSSKQADVILKFQKYGFENLDDVKRVYVIDEVLFNLMVDSIFFNRTSHDSEPNTNWNANKTKNEKITLNINEASSVELQKLQGIGPYFGDKIVEYRGKLGGFNNVEQLLDIWRFDLEKLEKIRVNLMVKGEIRKININTATYEELVGHPYIDSKVANSIVKYRSQHGNYVSVDSVLKSDLIDADLFLKLKPYLTT